MTRRLLSVLLSVALLTATGHRLAPDPPAGNGPRRNGGIVMPQDTAALLFVRSDGQAAAFAPSDQRAARQLARIARPERLTEPPRPAPALLAPASHPPAFHRKRPLPRSRSDSSPTAG
jgi:hypothetical protein